jgi:phosphoribosyl 1,2-cyclic phosphate phosphodiesterase
VPLTFLGTGSADGYPSAFCRCDHCQRARLLGGPSLRKRAAALVNDDLLIDPGPDVAVSAAQHGRPLTGVCHCLQTHAHADHFDPVLFLSRGSDWGFVGGSHLHYYASHASARRIAQLLERDFAPASFLDPAIGERLNLTVNIVEPLRPFVAGAYRVTPFAANHDASVEPLLYAIEADGRTIFYGTDTAPLPEETWRGFHQHRLRFDLVVLDHTYGEAPSQGDHLDARQFGEQITRLREEGLLNAGARIFAQHISHADNPPHPDLVEIAARRGYEVAYDGLTV